MVHSPKVVVKRTVAVDMMLEDESLPFLLVVAGRTAGNNQPRIKGNYFFYTATSSVKVSSVSLDNPGAFTPSCGSSDATA